MKGEGVMELGNVLEPTELQVLDSFENKARDEEDVRR
jgi:hypothetical protein